MVVFFRGSRWTIGNLDIADGQCRRLANRADCVVVSVEYRLAPEHPFPAPLKDAYAATEWVAENPGVVRGAPDQIGVAGISAGGNLAAGVSLLARDRDGPELAFQILIAPALVHVFDTESYEENATGYGLERADMKFFWDNYLTDSYDALNGYACPLAVHDLSDLPEAMVVTGGFDPLRDDGVRYAERLQAAGVTTDHLNYAICPTRCSVWSISRKELTPPRKPSPTSPEGSRSAFSRPRLTRPRRTSSIRDTDYRDYLLDRPTVVRSPLRN